MLCSNIAACKHRRLQRGAFPILLEDKIDIDQMFCRDCIRMDFHMYAAIDPYVRHFLELMYLDHLVLIHGMSVVAEDRAGTDKLFVSASELLKPKKEREILRSKEVNKTNDKCKRISKR